VLRLVPRDLPEDQRAFVFQIGKALRRKLVHRVDGLPYWELPRAAGLPFVIAVQAFHSSSSLFHAFALVADYVYGQRATAKHDAAGRLHVGAEAITHHEHRGKTIPSGLFGLPEARHLRLDDPGQHQLPEHLVPSPAASNPSRPKT
jgi:hypothetical protein